MPPGTSIFVMLFSTECSNREPEPFFAEDAASAEACGRANASTVSQLDIRIDGGPWLHGLDDAFAAAMPWTTVPWPEDNIFGLPGGGDLVRRLRLRRSDPAAPARHAHARADFVGEGAPPPTTDIITVARH